MNNAGKSNDERIVAYVVQNGRTPSLTIAGMKLALTVKFPGDFLLILSQKYDCCGTVKLKLYFNTQGQYSLRSATFSSEVKRKITPLSL